MSDDEDNACSQDVKNIAKEVVQVIMILDHNKKPFKQADIVSHMNQKPNRKNWKEIITEAKINLNCMGLELHETDNTSTKTYFLTSKTCPLKTSYSHASEEEVSSRILLTFVLAYIFMKNGVVDSDDLFNHLKDLGIYQESQTIHSYFGNIKKKVLTEYVDQLYLSVTKVPDSDLLELRWGQRAEIEITKRAILEFVCDYGFGGKIKPKFLTSHYEKVLEQEAKKKENDNSPDE